MARDIRRWILRVTIAETLGFGLAASVAAAVAASGIAPAPGYLLTIAGGAVEGAMLGVGQWLGMPGSRPPAVAWVGATSAGAAVAWSIGMLPSTVGFDPFSGAAAAVFVGGALLLLASIPVAQWLVLRTRRALHWIPVTMAAWAVAVLWTLAPSPLIDERSPLALVVGLYVAAGLLMAVTVAAATAVTAVRLFPHRRAPGRVSSGAAQPAG
ncbi:MAG TPA: hypothetical protein VL294_14490 [Pseudolysinimonas sp.]|nr:hypothetical protein [Pseudolysinimonas sp.]